MITCGGYAVIDGMHVPITGVSIREGQMIFHGIKRGPAREGSGTRPVTIFGEDGMGVLQADTDLSWPEMGEGETLHLHISLRMDQCFGKGEARD